MDASETGQVENKLLVMWIIWGAMAVSLVFYIVLCHLVVAEARRPLGPDFPLAILRNILFGIGIASLIAAYFMRKSILGKKAGVSGPNSAIKPPSPDIDTICGKYTTAMIIALALCEIVGICGLVLFFLGDSFQTVYAFVIISAAGMFHFRPKREEIEALSRAYS